MVTVHGAANASLDRIQASPSYTFRANALKHLRAAFSGKAMTEITQVVVESYVARRLDGGAAPATVNRERAVLSHLFTKAVASGWAKANPVAGTERQDEANENPRPATKSPGCSPYCPPVGAVGATGGSW